MHKVVLASGSKYFMNILNKYDAKVLTSAEVPAPLKTSGDQDAKVSDEILGLILKFLYNSQNFASIKEGVTESNVSKLLSQSYTLRCDMLTEALEKQIASSFLKPESALSFYADGVKFESEIIAEACRKIILKNMSSIIASEKGSEAIMNLPFRYMHALCESDGLKMASEQALASLIEKYLAHRDKIVTAPAAPPKPDFSGLTPEEKEAKEKELKEKEDAEKKAKEEKEKQEKADYDALSPLDKIKADLRKEQAAKALECDARLSIRKLSDDEKKQLFKTIRFSFMTHEELLALTANPAFALAKDFIVEGLSAKLSSFENAKNSGLQINLNKRDHLKVEDFEDELLLTVNKNIEKKKEIKAQAAGMLGSLGKKVLDQKDALQLKSIKEAASKMSATLGAQLLEQVDALETK